MAKKIFILLPDGVGLRNFAFTSFYAKGKELGNQVVFWNNTPFDLTELGFDEIKFPKSKIHFLTDLFKNALIEATLTVNSKRDQDPVYDTYRFKPNNNGFKNKVRNTIVRLLVILFSNQKGISFLRYMMQWWETKTSYYKYCQNLLEKEKPDFVFCTNQRPVVAIAPLLAAQKLKIPTATFIFSWDNLPKATMVVKTDKYFVWSDYMKNELLHYYPYIKKEQIVVTGTPQFEPHTNVENLSEKEAFYKEFNLDSNKKYICYSGDDITTCPDDEQYLNDVAQAVVSLNQKGYNLGVIFRRCPVDFSNRYDEVLTKYKNIIVPIQPAWEKRGEMWNTILPTSNDTKLLVNTIKYSEMVVNLGSSMVFDYVLFSKPCAYVNYDVTNKKQAHWSVKKIYQFVHFRSMPNLNSVVWLNEKEEIASKIEAALLQPDLYIDNAKKWLEIITAQPVQKASQAIWETIMKCMEEQ